MTTEPPALRYMWNRFHDNIASAKLGGIHAVKKGYHESVIYNLRNYPNNYSVELSLDRNVQGILREYSRAIDLSLATRADMIKYTKRLRASALDPKDNRLNCLREFYGTIDGENVYGLIHDGFNADWHISSADDSHLSHLHLSFFAMFCNNELMVDGVLSVLFGVSWEEWLGGSLGVALSKKGDSGQDVKFWQLMHNKVAKYFNPDVTLVEVDGDYGPNTARAVAAFYTAISKKDDWDGSEITGWMALQYHEYLIKVTVEGAK